MTHKIRKKIALARKNRQDISELIKDYNIKGEDLSYCYISELNVVSEDISGTNFSNSKLKLNAVRADIQDCKFVRTVFLPGSSIRSANARRINLFKANAGHNLDYAYADIRGGNLCGLIISIGSTVGANAKISENVMDLFKKWWNICPGESMLDIVDKG